MKIQKLRKALGAKRMIRGRPRPVLPLFIIAILMVGVGADLIYHYTVDVNTSGGEILGDPYWTKFTDLLDVEVDIVPLPSVVQNTYEDTDTYRLSLVNPLTRVAMVFQVTGTINTGVTVEAYLEEGETDTLWAEGDNYAVLMGDGNPDSVELYFRIHASYEAEIGSLGDFGFRFIACENPIIPFALSVDSITQGPGVELQDVATSTMQTTIDFGTIIPDDSAVINEDYLLYGLDHVLVQYEWTGLPADVHIAVDWSDDLGSTWNVWAPDVDYDLAYEEELLLRFSITADAGSDHSAGLAVGLVLTEGVAPVVPFTMSVDITQSGDGNVDITALDLTTILTSFDFGTLTQGVPTVYENAVYMCIGSTGGEWYDWTYLPADVVVTVQYSFNGGSSWSPWAPTEDLGGQGPGVNIHLKFTITANSGAEYPAGLVAIINFHGN